MEIGIDWHDHRHNYKKLHVGTKQNFNYLDIATNNELVSKNGHGKIVYKYSVYIGAVETFVFD